MCESLEDIIEHANIQVHRAFTVKEHIRGDKDE